MEALPENATLDGELLVLIDGRVQTFNTLQQRLNRKTVSKKLLESHPAHMRVYDVLRLGGQDLRPLPFVERRSRLQALVDEHDHPRLDLSPMVAFEDWHTLEDARADPASHGAEGDADAVEGVMIKRIDSAYVPGRPKGPWWKWKRDPMLIDAVLMYAQRGHGKRSSLYSDYTFGVWKPGEDGRMLVPVGKAYFGFTDEELKKIDSFVRKYTVNRFGPVREVIHGEDAGMVFEVAFEGLQRSTRHKSGVAMRFPRISASLGQATARSRHAGNGDGAAAGKRTELNVGVVSLNWSRITASPPATFKPSHCLCPSSPDLPAEPMHPVCATFSTLSFVKAERPRIVNRSPETR